MKLLRDVQAVSEFLFYLAGALLFLALLFWKNNSFAYQAEIILRYGDLPFAFIALVFAGTSLRMALSEGEDDGEEETQNPALDTMLVVFGLALFALLVYLDWGLPDVL